jgi:AcrR family transcriptional regulator
VESISETRRSLLEVAIEMVEEGGEAALRVDEVARRAGFTKPVVYTHFGDRDGLVIAVQTERYTRSLQYGLTGLVEQANRCRSCDEFVDLIERWLRSFFSPEGAKRRAFRIDVLGSAISRPALQASVQNANRAQADGVAFLVELAQARGWMPPHYDPVTVGIWITGVLLSRHLAEMAPDGYDTKAWDNLTLHAVLSLITCEGMSSA